jgi:3-phosphoinositide dependent protein kinase-1
VLHRDLKPENILLDSDFHLRLTDFGSAKVLPIVDGKVVREPATPSAPGATPDVLPGSHASRILPKRSFVGTAEYVSPEVLLSEPAAEPADFWALGCILYQFIAGSPPFRGKTEYLTFQKIKSLEYSFPDGFDSQARDLVERLLVLDPSKRLGAGPTGIEEIRSHAFFAGIDFARLFTRPPPKLESGLVGPPAPAVQRDLFAELGLDDVNESSEGEINDGMTPAAPAAAPLPDESFPSDEEDFEPPKGRWAHKSKHGGGKGGSVSSGTASIGTIGTLDPTSAVAQAIVGLGKGRPSSINTSISSGQTGEPYSPIQAQQSPGAGGQAEQDRHVSAPWSSPTGKSNRRSLPLLPDEKVLYSTAILVPSSPSIVKTLNPLSRPARERFLILTDFPRLLCVKQDPKGDGSFKLKYECLIVRRGTGSGIGGSAAGGGNVLKTVKEKGAKGLSVHTVRFRLLPLSVSCRRLLISRRHPAIPVRFDQHLCLRG